MFAPHIRTQIPARYIILLTPHYGGSTFIYCSLFHKLELYISVKRDICTFVAPLSIFINSYVLYLASGLQMTVLGSLAYYNTTCFFYRPWDTKSVFFLNLSISNSILLSYCLVH